MQQIFLGGPDTLRRQASLGWLVVHLTLGDAVSRWQPGNPRLRSNSAVSQSHVFVHFIDSLLDVVSVRVAINHYSGAALSSKQVVDRSVESFALNVPQRDVDCTNRRHRHWPAPPVRAAIKILPNIFGLKRIAANQAGNQMLGKISRDRHLAPVKRCVAEAVNPLVGVNL